MKEIVYPKLSYKITGLLFQVHNELGRLRKEKYYADLLETKLKEAGLKYEREKSLPSKRESNPDRVDFYIENKVLVDIKSKKFITKQDYFQMVNYLKTLDLKLGLIVNFRNTYLKPKRIINLH